MSTLSHLLSHPRFLFQDFFDEVSPIKQTASNWNPRADLLEEENEYLVRAEVPGVEKDQIKVSLENKVLSVHGERKSFEENKDQKLYRSELHIGQFSRQFHLPKDVDVEKIDAQLKNGILEIRLPKSAEQHVKEIPVNV